MVLSTDAPDPRLTLFPYTKRLTRMASVARCFTGVNC